MPTHTVVVSDHDFDTLDIEREVLDDVADVRDAGGDVDVDANVDEYLIDADAVLNLRYDIDRTLIERMDDCRIVARYGIGVDNVDLEAATERGLYVTNVPDYCQEEVATHALSLLLSLYRGVTRYTESVTAGEWERDVATPIRRLSTQTLGIVGFGAIGRAVADRAAALGFDLVTSDPFIDEETAADHGAELVAFETLLKRADAVTIHSPLTPETRDLFDADAFARMRESAVLVNVARGPIVDADALLAALDAGEIAGAGLDVFPDEPPVADDPLRTHDRVVATPHVAWYSEEANAERRRKAAENVRAALLGDRPANLVNDV
ncbi:C-terminal binding protein [Halosolutus halophilus]|uniref:C-terminal binding protein n=1 Tax=Halosolutus halophilus TaxID=1552990 RepID=UPI002234F3B7|nr:C-terminal binding protein [Halosolutus halophilus]